MRQDKQDRRSLRTRRLVSEALMGLLLEKRYDAITVQDLLDRAGIGRATFYAHYFDKDDVLAHITEQMLESFRLRVAQYDPDPGDPRPNAYTIVPSLELFRHVHLQYPQLRPLVRGHAGEVIWEAGQTLLARNIEQALTAMQPPTDRSAVPISVTARYLAGALLNVLKWWLDAEMPYTPEEMDTMFQQLALPGVWAVVNTPPRESVVG
jgi:AcrR family transcriptional regulator